MSAPVVTNAHIDAGLRAVSEEYAIPIKQLKSRLRDAVTSEARMFFWFLMKIATDGTNGQLAGAVGRTHFAVSVAARKAIIWLRVYPRLRQRYDRMAARFCELTQ